MKYLVLSLSLILSACSFTPAQEVDGPIGYDEANYFYWPNTEENYQVLYEVETLEDWHFSGQYPVIANLDAQHPLKKAIDTYKTAVTNAQSERQTQIQAMSDDDPEASIGHDYSVEWLGGRYHPDLWSLALQVYTYTGGARPTHWTDTYNYSPALEQIVLLEDLFTSNEALVTLEKSLFDNVLAEKAKRWTQWGTQEAYDPSKDAFTDGKVFDIGTLNRWVTAEKDKQVGLLFFFDPDEIGSYTEGGYEVFVPASVFNEWLKEEFKAVFN